MQTNLIVYASSHKRCQRLLEAIRPQASQCTLVTVQDTDTLRTCFQKLFSGPIWAILVTENQLELDAIIKLDDLLCSTRIILILHNEHPDTLMAGHTLYPRFISFLESDFRDVGSVLKKVIHNNRELPN